jgi:hypothetical protein
MRASSIRVAAQASPFNCAWIPKESIGRLDGFSYAVCSRIPDFARTVSEEDCVHCPLWQERPTDLDDRSLFTFI